MPAEYDRTLALVSVETGPPGLLWPALAANRSAATSPDLRGGEERQGRLASQQPLRPPARCVACIQRCRYAALLGPPPPDPAAKPPPNRRPLWLPLHSAAARQARLRSLRHQPNPPQKEPHQENSYSSLPAS